MSKTNVTRIEREHFLLHVPFKWRAVREQPLEFEFHNEALPEQLIISSLPHQQPLSIRQLRTSAERLGHARLKAITQVSKGAATWSPVAYKNSESDVDALVSA